MAHAGQEHQFGSRLRVTAGAALTFIDIRSSYAVFIAIPIMYVLPDSSLAVEDPK